MYRDKWKKNERYYKNSDTISQDHASFKAEHVVVPFDLGPCIRNNGIVRATQDGVQEEKEEKLEVVRADAVVDKQTVVIHLLDTALADFAVMCALRSVMRALFAKFRTILMTLCNIRRRILDIGILIYEAIQNDLDDSV